MTEPSGSSREMGEGYKYVSLGFTFAGGIIFFMGMGFLLLGGPGETRASVEESLTFVDALNMDAVRVTVGIRIYPHTALAETALQEGVLSAGDNLLFPRFYLGRGLEDWLPETVRAWARGRPNVIV